MPRLLGTVAVIVVALAGTATASEWPNEEQLKTQFLLQLPGYWTLSTFEVEATANYGTEVEPTIKSRFNAVVELRADTFALQEQEGVITWLAPVAEAGETRTVYGISTSTRAAGAWQIEFTLENNPMPRLGQPRDFFSGRTIVRGGDEEAAYLQELAQPRLVEEEMRHKEEVARRQREMELEELDHQAEVARLRQQEELDTAEQEAAARAAEAERLAAEAALAELADRARSQLVFELPGYWRLAEFNLREAKAEGDDLVQAFSATIELASATFLESEREGPVVVVTPVAKAGERRELLGTVRWSRAGEAWNGAFTFENNPMEGLGRPLDFFEGRVLIAGSEEEAAWRKSRHAEEIARLEHEEELRAKEREAELEALTHRERLDEAEHARAEAEAAAKKAELEALIAGIAEELRARVAIGLPGHWRLEGFEIQEHAWRGEGQSELELSFAAEAELAADTFTEAERDDAVLFVTPVASGGERRTIYGAGTARHAGEGWEYEVQSHNDPVAGLGLPIDYFEGRVLVQGSEEAKAYLEQQHQEELARRKREDELREQERQAALDEQRHEQLLEEERQKVELARAAFEAQLREEMDQQKERKYRQLLVALQEALAKTEPHKSIAAWEAIVATENPLLQREAVEIALDSSGPLKDTAVTTALASDDADLRQAALLQRLSEIQSLPVTHTRRDRHYNTQFFVKEVDRKTGAIRGDYVATGGEAGGSRKDETGTFTGQVTGNGLTVQYGRCGTRVGLDSPDRFKGNTVCGNYEYITEVVLP